MAPSEADVWSIGPSFCLPKELGGLVIPDLRLSSITLQTKWLWLQHTNTHHAWSELSIETAPKVLAFFNASTYMVLGTTIKPSSRQGIGWTDRPSKTSHQF
jgi:hypothetical protein